MLVSFLTPFGKKGTQYSTLFLKGDLERMTVGGMEDGGGWTNLSERKTLGNVGPARLWGTPHHPQLGSQWHRVMGVKPIRNPPSFKKKQCVLELPRFGNKSGPVRLAIWNRECPLQRGWTTNAPMP